MQLYKSGEKLYKCYLETIKELQTKPALQPRKRKMPFYMLVPARLIQFIVLFFFIYCFFLIIQLALFNLVIVGIILVFISKIWQFLEAFIDKFKFNYKTKDFVAFIEQQNQTVYHALDIEIQADREGNWLEFLLRDDEQMFEQQIAIRRQQIFKEGDTYAIEEMKRILQNYTKEKEEESKQN